MHYTDYYAETIAQTAELELMILNGFYELFVKKTTLSILFTEAVH